MYYNVRWGISLNSRQIIILKSLDSQLRRRLPTAALTNSSALNSLISQGLVEQRMEVIKQVKGHEVRQPHLYLTPRGVQIRDMALSDITAVTGDLAVA